MSAQQFIGSEYVTHIEQIQPPQPAESPDDWVTQDLVPSRRGIDELNWIFSGERHGSWVPYGPPITHGVTDKCGDIGQVRCRRRDYPQKPAEVHTGGPYVARSEYERVCATIRKLETGYAAAVRRAEDMASQLTVMTGERDQLKADQESLLADLKATEQTVIHLNKRVFADAANGWPLVPVDPSCIPDGYRVVEVTKDVMGKLVAVQNKTVRMSSSIYANLIVEPIPTPTPDPLPRPGFPKWIRAGWWVAMDADGDWFGYEKESTLIDELKQWGSTIPFPIIISQLTPSMRAVPRDRWREAKWQIE